MVTLKGTQRGLAEQRGAGALKKCPRAPLALLGHILHFYVISKVNTDPTENTLPLFPKPNPSKATDI